MPCFNNGPDPGTQEYDDWLLAVQPKLDAFTHVIDYYYRKAKLPMPQPSTLDRLREWCTAKELPSDLTEAIDPNENRKVLRQILHHLDCDSVDVFQLNDIRNLLFTVRTPKRIGYIFALNYCFAALRNNDV